MNPGTDPGQVETKAGQPARSLDPKGDEHPVGPIAPRHRGWFWTLALVIRAVMIVALLLWAAVRWLFGR